MFRDAVRGATNWLLDQQFLVERNGRAEQRELSGRLLWRHRRHPGS